MLQRSQDKPSSTIQPRAIAAGGDDSPKRCSACRMQQFCLPTGLTEWEKQKLANIVALPRKIGRGTCVYHIGDPFSSLYAIRTGHFKTHLVSPDGREQITGFQVAGDLLGLDAISSKRQHSYATALEDSEVCEIPFCRLQELFAEVPVLLHRFHRAMSEEISREQNTILLLGKMHAEQRLAVFLINLSSRYASRGCSSSDFQLRMSRADIGNYLSLTIESISRLLARFRQRHLIDVRGRNIRLLDIPALKLIACGKQPGSSASLPI